MSDPRACQPPVLLKVTPKVFGEGRLITNSARSVRGMCLCVDGQPEPKCKSRMNSNAKPVWTSPPQKKQWIFDWLPGFLCQPCAGKKKQWIGGTGGSCNSHWDGRIWFRTEILDVSAVSGHPRAGQFLPKGHILHPHTVKYSILTVFANWEMTEKHRRY